MKTHHKHHHHHHFAGGTRHSANAAATTTSNEAEAIAGGGLLGGGGGGPLNDEELRTLAAHKYQASDVSLIEPLMQKFWNGLIGYLPLSVAPNTLTIVGFLLNAAASLCLLYYSPDAKQQVPSWALLLAALGLFIYQTLDALDGKQARRTNSSSPLGEIFDHGCDSLTTGMVVLAKSVATGMGHNPHLMFTEVLMCMSLFYLAHWHAYVTDVVQFGKIDVTEGQLSGIIVHIISAIYGIDIWSFQVPWLGLSMRQVSFLVVFTSCVVMALRFIKVIKRGGKGRQGTTVANTSVLFPGIVLLCPISMALTIAYKSRCDIFSHHPLAYLLLFVLVIAKIANRIIVAHMCRSELSLLDSALAAPALLILNQYVLSSLLPEPLLLAAAILYAAYDLFAYNVRACLQIANFLNIYVFRVDKPPPLPHSPASSSPSSNSNTNANANANTTQSSSSSSKKNK